MPVPLPRDPQVVQEGLTDWLRNRLPGASVIGVTELQVPQGIGFSNETILFRASWTDADGEPHDEKLALRIQPQGGHQLFYEGDIRDVLFQAQMIRGMRPHGVPVATVRWEEPDPAWLGGPFFIMDCVDGRSPTDFPSYNAEGWVADLTPERRRELWDNAMEAFARVHAVDWRDGFEFLDHSHRGTVGLDQALTFLEEWHGWATRGRPMPIVDDALEYVLKNRPEQTTAPGVVWGDCRIGNMMFHDDLTVAAVCDWEFASLGPPEMDLGWWLFLDSWNSDGIKVPRLPGLPGHDETIAHYEAITGRPVRDIHYYEVMAGLRFCLVSMRATDQMVEWGIQDPSTKGHWCNPVACLTARLLGLPDPEGWDAMLTGDWGGGE